MGCGYQVAIPTYVAEVAPREIRGVSIGLFAFEREWLGACANTFR